MSTLRKTSKQDTFLDKSADKFAFAGAIHLICTKNFRAADQLNPKSPDTHPPL